MGDDTERAVKHLAATVEGRLTVAVAAAEGAIEEEIKKAVEDLDFQKIVGRVVGQSARDFLREALYASVSAVWSDPLTRNVSMQGMLRGMREGFANRLELLEEQEKVVREERAMRDAPKKAEEGTD